MFDVVIKEVDRGEVDAKMQMFQGRGESSESLAIYALEWLYALKRQCFSPMWWRTYRQIPDIADHVWNRRMNSTTSSFFVTGPAAFRSESISAFQYEVLQLRAVDRNQSKYMRGNGWQKAEFQL